MLASALRRQGHAEEAKTILERVLGAEPDFAFAQLELGLILGLLGRQAALESFARAVDLSPTFVDAWWAIGVAAESRAAFGSSDRPTDVT